jgi:alpha-glucosidase
LDSWISYSYLGLKSIQFFIFGLDFYCLTKKLTQMKYIFYYTATLLIFASLGLTSCNRSAKYSVNSPGGEISVNVSINEAGNAIYGISFKKQSLIENSVLGIIREDADFSSGMKIDSVSEVSGIHDSYSLLYGKRKEVSYVANKRIFHLSNLSMKRMDIIFQVSDDGVAFCYNFPDSSSEVKKIAVENTSFNFTDSTSAWIQPKAKARSGWNHCNPSYEEHYLEDIALSKVEPNDTGWVFPALFHTKNCWINLTESWPDRNYCGSHLQKGSLANEMIIAFPESDEGFTNGVVYPESKLPWTTPWRIITIGINPGVIVESTLGTDLARPSVSGDFTYVKPGRASWSWVLMKDPSVNYAVQKEFIEYASSMGWEYCLIDADWDTRIGWNKIEELARLAAKKNVGLILWYNSAGDWNTVPYHPKDILLTRESRNKEFAKLNAIGIKGIKVDFFGGDGQSMMDYYQDILMDAHKYQLVVNCHGATLPRGLQRTFPNLVSMEAIRGLEYATFGQETADKVPAKVALLAFTRNAFDPMDFTPVCFNDYDNNRRVTGNGAELAQAVIFLSGIQHYAEIPSGMAKVPDYVKVLMQEIPVVWDETTYIDGYPGRFLALARRSGKEWYIAGINAERETKILNLHLPFVKQKTGMLTGEGDSLRSFSQTQINLDSLNSFEVKVKPNGGFVLKIIDN